MSLVVFVLEYVLDVTQNAAFLCTRENVVCFMG